MPMLVSRLLPLPGNLTSGFVALGRLNSSAAMFDEGNSHSGLQRARGGDSNAGRVVCAVVCALRVTD